MPKRRTQNVKLSSVKRTIVKSHRKENGRKGLYYISNILRIQCSRMCIAVLLMIQSLFQNIFNILF